MDHGAGVIAASADGENAGGEGGDDDGVGDVGSSGGLEGLGQVARLAVVVSGKKTFRFGYVGVPNQRIAFS